LPGGGKVQITSRYQKAIDCVRIDCRDDGVGIPKEALSRVFEPFFTMKPRGLEKSSGLGLSIVYSIIKTHQGQVKIKSEYRKGTLVTILLPTYKHKKRIRS
jgi:signal transduction histidine kinase